MIAINLPKGTRVVADKLKDCFETTSYQGISAVIAGFLLGQTSISEQVRTCAFAKSVSTQSRIIHSFNHNRAQKRLFLAGIRLLGKSDPKDLVYAIDDTANPKYGKNIFANSFWGSSSGVYQGQKVLVIAIVDLKRKVSVPISYAILNKQDMADLNSLDVGIELFRQLREQGLPTGIVVADSWFDSVSFAAQLKELGLFYVWQIKSNRLIKTNPSPNSPWKHLDEAFAKVTRYRTITPWDQLKIRKRQKKGKCIAEIHGQIKGRKSPIKTIAVYNRRNGASPYGCFASTDQSQSRARIWMISRSRWAIEVIFRTVKQNLSFGKLSCTGEEAAHLAVCLPFYLYTMLQAQKPETWGLKKIESIDLMIAKIKNKTFTNAMSNIIYRPESDQLKLLRNRRSAPNGNVGM